MKRRHFFESSLALAGLALAEGTKSASAQSKEAAKPGASIPKAGLPGLTKYVSEFIANSTYEGIPSEVLELGKKSILDGFGLALAGSVSEHRHALLKYLQSMESKGKSSVIGTKLKSAPRFASFANGVWIHADDFDDTQLAVSKDRVYGLLTHPTVPVLPPVFALCELGRHSGKDFLLGGFKDQVQKVKRDVA